MAMKRPNPFAAGGKFGASKAPPFGKGGPKAAVGADGTKPNPFVKKPLPKKPRGAGLPY